MNFYKQLASYAFWQTSEHKYVKDIKFAIGHVLEVFKVKDETKQVYAIWPEL
jgi:hypothetical protein